ncbi:DEAD/DEAH box helicase [Paenarthrobacter sp. YJN-5]|uniref:Chromodomain-helicase-DNA-binding protein 1-like n=1 Tax=Paenarthrobacter ureafaciens TaxID=37931 RepID=A0A345BEM4_PAEUR|nr:DEAD/DEAH box helicase [Paenarthrobacter sp. YJN-5]AXF48698.1 chromodomain-helicase-DNA-binding protein 1-like [Paenarthrobacter ureafaciens]QOT19482.1 DEAD/DEAH box helicase [Paenarthrobacter sp. YJN-5]
MSRQVLARSWLRDIARTHRPGTVPPMVLNLEAPDVDTMRDPASLLRSCVRLTALPHPSIHSLLIAAGARRNDGVYTVELAHADLPQVARALALTPSSTWTTAKGTTLEQALAPLVGHLPPLDAGKRRPDRMAGMRIVIASSRRTLHLDIALDGPLVRGWPIGEPVGRGSARTTTLDLTPSDADAISDAALQQRLILTTGSPARLEEMWQRVDSGATITAAPGAPGLALINTGRDLQRPPAGPVPAATATAWLPARSTSYAGRGPLPQVAVSPAVTQAAAVHRILSAPTPVAARERLHPWQDAFVDAFLASGPGMVNSLPPGTGKTVCASAAMAEHAASGTRYLGVVIAPKVLRAQWTRELGIFCPAVSVVCPPNAHELASALAESADQPGKRVVIATPALLAGVYGEFAPAPIDDLVVDEAVYLSAASSLRTEATWWLRRHARHAMPMSGTPDQHGPEGVGRLLAFARGEADLFAEVSLPADWRPAVGQLVYAGNDSLGKQLPQVHDTVVTCPAGRLETLIDEAAAKMSVELLGRAKPSALEARRLLDSWRLGLASPRALLESRHPLGRRLRDQLEADEADLNSELAAAGETGKVGWVVSWIRGRVDSPTLVFSDFPSALDEVAAELRAHGIACASITGATSAADQQGAAAAFTTGDIKVLLLSGAGHLGLNLQVADAVVHLDVPPKAAAMVQRTARAARLGSATDQVHAMVPVIENAGDHLLHAALHPDLHPELNAGRSTGRARSGRRKQSSAPALTDGAGPLDVLAALVG